MFCLRADRARAREPSLACAPLAGRRRRRRRRRGPRGETMTAKKSYYNRGTISPIVFWLAYRGEESRGGAFIGFMRQQWLVIQRTFRGYLLFLPSLSLFLPRWLTRALPYIYMYIYIYSILGRIRAATIERFGNGRAPIIAVIKPSAFLSLPLFYSFLTSRSWFARFLLLLLIFIIIIRERIFFREG